jgi:hypothetical protein
VLLFYEGIPVRHLYRTVVFVALFGVGCAHQATTQSPRAPSSVEWLQIKIECPSAFLMTTLSTDLRSSAPDSSLIGPQGVDRAVSSNFLTFVDAKAQLIGGRVAIEMISSPTSYYPQLEATAEVHILNSTLSVGEFDAFVNAHVANSHLHPLNLTNESCHATIKRPPPGMGL